ncbi:hypothetical protein HDU96_007646 [Phlyctochytrium bullatum]|nr:hypothetical protein HDU96_007646 [Phlyctochytrium bullatum]
MDGADFENDASEHFKMKRVPRDIDMTEKGERLECERIMKTYETLFTVARRTLKRMYLEIEEELPRIGTGLSTILTHREDEDHMKSDIDKEDLWRQRLDLDPSMQIPRDEDLDEEIDDEDDLAHFATYERRISRVSDGMVVRRKSVAPGNATRRTSTLPGFMQAPNEADELDDSGGRDPNRNSIATVRESSIIGSPRSSSASTPRNEEEAPPPPPPVTNPTGGERRWSVLPSGFRRESAAVAANPQGFQFPMKATHGLLKQANDSEELRKIAMRDIEHIYVKIDRTVDFTLVCVSNILLILGCSEILEDRTNFEKFYTFAHEISADFVSNTLKTVWDLLNRELPGIMDLQQLRNPDLLKQRLKDVQDLRLNNPKAPKNKIRKLYRKFILIHELLRAVDIHIFPNFVPAHKDGLKYGTHRARLAKEP